MKNPIKTLANKYIKTKYFVHRIPMSGYERLKEFWNEYIDIWARISIIIFISLNLIRLVSNT